MRQISKLVSEGMNCGRFPEPGASLIERRRRLKMTLTLREEIFDVRLGSDKRLC